MAICTSLDCKCVQDCISAALSEEMVEIRADLCGFAVEETLQAVRQINCPVVLTARGRYEDRFLARVLESSAQGDVQYVDVELEAPHTYSEQVRSKSHSLGAGFIVSFHDFHDTPCIDELLEIYDLCVSRGADIVKIVTTAAITEEASRVLLLYECTSPKVPLIAFAMGEAGRFSRRLCLAKGAPWTYCAAGVESIVAPGQWTSGQMRRSLAPANYPFNARNLPVAAEGGLPSSKSMAQRAIVAASLASGTSVLRGYCGCDDTASALGVAGSLGAGVSAEGDVLRISGVDIREALCRELNVGESGLLARLMIPLGTLLTPRNGQVIVKGTGTLTGRVLSDALEAVETSGGDAMADDGKVPFILRGALKGGHIRVDGSRSSQSVSGLLMTLPLVGGDSLLTVDRLVSVPYIDMTVEVMAAFGVCVEKVSQSSGCMVFRITGGQNYQPSEITLEPDWSSAAYFMAADHIARSFRPERHFSIPELGRGTSQADERVADLLDMCGDLKPFIFDATDCPDLFPIAAALACFCDGTSIIKGVGRLYEKESNRAEAILSEFSILGAFIFIRGDGMHIRGGHLHGGCVSSHHDHRMAMSLAVAAQFIDEPVMLDDVCCIDKSFPTFAYMLNRRQGC